MCYGCNVVQENTGETGVRPFTTGRVLCFMFILLAGLGCGSEGTDPDPGVPAIEGPYADLGDVRIFFEVHGSGDPVLFLHGGFSNSRIWEKQLPDLSEKYQVITMDSRGHGRSTDGDGPITYELLAWDAERLLDLLGIERAHVVGWSDGGVAGLRMGISYPDRLDKLVTIGASAQGPGSLNDIPSLMFENQNLFNFLMDLLFQAEYEEDNPEPQWEVFRDKIFELWTAECYFTPGAGEECMAPLGGITHEALVMAGELEMIRKEHTEAIHRHLPNSELLFIPGGSHFVMQEKPAVVNAAILDFLE